MANVPEETVPTVPESAQPTPRVSITTPPEAFSGNVVAQAAGELGKAFGQRADAAFGYAQQFQAINNKLAADQASIAAARATDDLWVKYQATHKGLNAYTNLPDFYKEVEATRAGFGEGLSKVAQAEFDGASRRLVYSTLSEASRYASSQRMDELNKNADGMIDAAGHAFVTAPDDPDTLSHFQQTLGSQAATIFSPYDQQSAAPMIHQWIQQKGSPVYASVISQALASDDPQKANALLTKYRDGLTDEAYTTLAKALRGYNTANDIQAAGKAIVDGGEYSPSGQPFGEGTNSFLEGVHGREGSGQNLHSTAQGFDQFTRQTWLRILKTDPEFAGQVKGLSDEQILSLRNNQTVADRATIAYAAENAPKLAAAGFPSTNANLGLAHGFGSEGALKILEAADANPATPVASVIGQHTADINGIGSATVGAVVAGFNRRFGGGGMAPGAHPAGAAFDPLVTIKPDSNVDQLEAEGLAGIFQRAEALAPWNALRQHQIIEAANSYLKLKLDQVRATQAATYDSVDQAIIAGKITDPTVLNKQFAPQMAQLPAKYQAALQRETQIQGNLHTQEADQSYQNALGQWSLSHDDPSAFLALDVRSLPVTSAQRQDLIRKQAQVRAWASEGTNKEEGIVSGTLKGIQGQQIVKSLHLVDAQGNATPGYYQLAGALQQQVEGWRASHAGANPNQQEMRALLSSVSATVGAKPGGFFGLGGDAGRPAFQPDPQTRGLILKHYQSRGVAPSESDIARDFGYLRQGQIPPAW